MDKHINLDCKEGERASKNMSIRQESYMVGKSGCKSNGEKDLSHTSTPSAGSGMIRVIHIFAPKIIKTDAANFRELVQRLTGNTKRSRSGNKSKRSAKFVTSSLPSTQQILSQYSNATKIFASSSRVEYCIPRSPDSHFPAPHILDFYQQEEDVKPRIGRQPSSINFSGSSPDQSCCSPVLPFAEVISPGFHSQELNSIHVDSNDGIPNSAMRNSRMQQQQKKKVSTSASIMVDPFESLSGYREKLPPTPQRLSTSAFLSHFDERSHLMLNNRFSDMDTLDGLVMPGSLRRIPMPLPPHMTNTSSDFTFQSSLLNNSNALCRFSVQSPLRGGIQQMFDNSSSFLA